jgi:hypothetical protein
VVSLAVDVVYTVSKIREDDNIVAEIIAADILSALRNARTVVIHEVVNTGFRAIRVVPLAEYIRIHRITCNAVVLPDYHKSTHLVGCHAGIVLLIRIGIVIDPEIGADPGAVMEKTLSEYIIICVSIVIPCNDEVAVSV